MSYADKTLRCRDCGDDFLFSSGEQEFYAAKGLTNEPGRCPSCRAIMKGQRAAQGYQSMPGTPSPAPRNWQQPIGASPPPTPRPFQGPPRRQMHVTVCANCGGEAVVPFLPRGDRPVYCTTCFDHMRQS